MNDRLKPLDAFFLAAETRRSPWHAGACEIFAKHAERSDEFVASLLREWRDQEAVFPFNVAPDGRSLWPRWRQAEVDLDYHVQHQILPAPGTERELMAALEHFYASTLDHNLPLWECCVFDGLEDDRFAIAFKLHHSLTDGQGGLKLILNALSLRQRDRMARALWADNSSNDTFSPVRKKRSAAKPARNGGALRLLQGLGRNATQLVDPKRLDQLRDLRLFRAPRSVMNQPPQSSARRFGIGDLSLPLMKQVAKASKASVNDVLLCAVDAGLHRYLSEHGSDVPRALVCAMPVSVRSEDSEGGGNQAGMLTVELGLPDSDLNSRLERIKESTARAKSNLRQLPNSLLVGYGLAVLGTPLLLEQIPGLAEALPVVNLGISNVSPPPGSNYLGKSLYLRGAKLTGLYTLPILPPSVLLNVTAASFEDKLCLGIGSTREAVADPIRLAAYIAAALDELASECGVATSKKRPRRRKPKAA